MRFLYRRNVWKVILFLLAALIIAISLFYTNKLIEQIAEGERRQAKLWANAIQEKANLVKATNKIFEAVAIEEKKKAELIAKTTKKLSTADPFKEDLGFFLEIIKNNTTIPIIQTDNKGNIKDSRNLDSIKDNSEALALELGKMKDHYRPIVVQVSSKTVDYFYYNDSKIFQELRNVVDRTLNLFISEVINSANLPTAYADSSKRLLLAHNFDQYQDFSQGKTPEELFEIIKRETPPIEIELSDGQKFYVYYKESSILTQFRFFPFIQFSIIAVFLIISYVLFNTSKKSEQNQVWVGMSKETAHQLGTPISSMMAWIELLKVQYGENEETLIEIGKDIKRLEIITERFSKIGSAPDLTEQNISDAITSTVDYLKKRISPKVNFITEGLSENLITEINPSLFSWVIENISKNAVDAMEGRGEISFTTGTLTPTTLFIDIKDTGKGLPKSKFKTIFQPGYSSKKRGWGLGLTLVRRIIFNYHDGKIFVKESELGQGTTFRIILKKVAEY